jgi:hypothetical protein
VAEFIVQRITVANGRVKRIGTNLVIEVAPQRGRSSAVATWCEITEAEGTAPPFLYSAVEVEWNSTTHAFVTKSGGITITAALYNVAEDAYPGAGKLPIGRPVQFWTKGADYICDVLNYRGVYPGDG